MIHNSSNKQEPVFELVKSLSKAEKRNFKLYATRLSGNQEAKFVSLFDCMDSIDLYDEAHVLQRTTIKKEQLPNMKAHLYKQILISVRLLETQRNPAMQLREQIEFARILYNKALYKQCGKILSKALEQTLALRQHTSVIEIIDLQRKLEALDISSGMAIKSNVSSRVASEMCHVIINVNELSNLSTQLYGLYLKLGYARNQKDLNMITTVFGPKLSIYKINELSFVEKFHLYQSFAWYYYIQHDMLSCYKHVCNWILLFDSSPQMKRLMYDSYLRGYSRLLDGLFLLRNHKRFVRKLEDFEDEFERIGNDASDNERMIALQIVYANRINRHFYEGTFSEGIKIIPEVEAYLESFRNQISIHHSMVLYYKIACLHFGNGSYRKCMQYLSPIISTRDPQMRRDLQCFARILNLICSYEAGIDYNIDYQVRSVYVFLVKMNDMNMVQRELMASLKRLNSLYEDSIREELKSLYNRLKQYEHHPYERRTFYYLDLLSWLESKLTGVPVSDIIRNRFLAENKN